MWIIKLICPWDSLWQWKSECKWSSPSTSITCYPTPSHWWTISWHHSDLGWKMTGKFIILHCLRNKFLNIASHAYMKENKGKRIRRGVIKLFTFFAFYPCAWHVTLHCIFEINSTWKKISIHRTMQRLMAISMFESFAATLFYLQQVFLFAACPLWATVADRLIDLWLYLFWFHNIQGLNLQTNSPSLRQLLTRWVKLQQGWVCIFVWQNWFLFQYFLPAPPLPPQMLLLADG